MDQSGHAPAQHVVDDATPTAGGVPPGDHPLEVAARKGFGPLSPAAIEAWHGGAQPCVTCGQLVRRDAVACDHCGQDLTPAMIERMRNHAGPWYVLEHLRPFPGVSLDRIIRQVQRGLITETSIVRGPATDHQWRFAVETPGLCRFFRKCWHCHRETTLAETVCRACGASTSFDRSVSTAGPTGDVRGRNASTQPARIAQPSPDVARSASHESAELTMLRAAARVEARRRTQEGAGDVMTVGGIRVGWLAVAIVVAVFGALVLITRTRGRDVAPAREPTTVTPILVPSDPGDVPVTPKNEP